MRIYVGLKAIFPRLLGKKEGRPFLEASVPSCKYSCIYLRFMLYTIKTNIITDIQMALAPKNFIFGLLFLFG